MKDWNQDYIDNGIKAQRLYPNEALLQFMGAEGLLSGDIKADILEVGCGSGANLWMMAKEGHKVSGMDCSQEALNIAKDHLRDKWGVTASLSKGVFTEIPYGDESFDYVVDIVSMQHISILETERALMEIRRVLREGGKFFSVRIGDGSTAFFNGQPMDKKIDAVTLENIVDEHLPLNNNGMISFWSPGIVSLEYSKLGFRIESTERYSRTYKNGLYRVEYLVITARK